MGEESPTSQVRKRCFGLRMEKEKGSSLEFELFADHHLSTDSSNKSPFLLQFIQELKAICQPQTVWQSQNPRPGSLSISKHLTWVASPSKLQTGPTSILITIPIPNARCADQNMNEPRNESQSPSLAFSGDPSPMPDPDPDPASRKVSPYRKGKVRCKASALSPLVETAFFWHTEKSVPVLYNWYLALLQTTAVLRYCFTAYICSEELVSGEGRQAWRFRYFWILIIFPSLAELYRTGDVGTWSRMEPPPNGTSVNSPSQPKPRRRLYCKVPIPSCFSTKQHRVKGQYRYEVPYLKSRSLTYRVFRTFPFQVSIPSWTWQSRPRPQPRIKSPRSWSRRGRDSNRGIILEGLGFSIGKIMVLTPHRTACAGSERYARYGVKASGRRTVTGGALGRYGWSSSYCTALILISGCWLMGLLLINCDLFLVRWCAQVNRIQIMEIVEAHGLIMIPRLLSIGYSLDSIRNYPQDKYKLRFLERSQPEKKWKSLPKPWIRRNSPW